MHDDKELHITCDCHSHELHFERDPFFDAGDHIWYGSFWMRGYKEKIFGWRWKQAWHIIRTGRPYGDEVVLKKKDMQELLEYIQAQLKATEGK